MDILPMLHDSCTICHRNYMVNTFYIFYIRKIGWRTVYRIICIQDVHSRRDKPYVSRNRRKAAADLTAESR